MSRQNRTDSEDTSGRGVSDAIGFTLTFTIILIGAGVISLAGGSQLATFSEVEEVRSAERGMESAAATLQPLATQGDRQRSFSIAFSNSNVWLNETVLNITTDGSVAYSDLTVNALEQRFDRDDGDVTIRYEAGGVFRSNAVPAFDPNFECRTESTGTTALVTVLNLTLADRDGLYVSEGYNPDLGLDEFAGSSESPVVSTDAALTFEARVVDSQRSYTDAATDVFVNTTRTAGPEQWELYFQEADNWTNPDDDVYKCDADRMLVRVVTVELDIVQPEYSG